MGKGGRGNGSVWAERGRGGQSKSAGRVRDPARDRDRRLAAAELYGDGLWARDSGRAVEAAGTTAGAPGESLDGAEPRVQRCARAAWPRATGRGDQGGSDR